MSFKFAGSKGKSKQGKDTGQLPLPERYTMEKLLQTKISLFTFPNHRNFMSSLWQVIQRWFSHKPAKENLRFVGCTVGDFFG